MMGCLCCINVLSFLTVRDHLYVIRSAGVYLRWLRNRVLVIWVGVAWRRVKACKLRSDPVLACCFLLPRAGRTGGPASGQVAGDLQGILPYSFACCGDWLDLVGSQIRGHGAQR